MTKSCKEEIMTEDFYCDEVLSGKNQVNKVLETEKVLAYYHTRPFYPVNIVAIPKKHIISYITLEESVNDILIELIDVTKQIASKVTKEKGACRVITNLCN